MKFKRKREKESGVFERAKCLCVKCNEAMIIYNGRERRKKKMKRKRKMKGGKVLKLMKKGF